MINQYLRLFSLSIIFLFISGKVLADALPQNMMIISDLIMWSDTKTKTLQLLGQPDSISKIDNEIDDIELTLWKYGKSELHFDSEHLSNFVLRDRSLDLTVLKDVYVGQSKATLIITLNNRGFSIINGDSALRLPIADTAYFLLIEFEQQHISSISIWLDN